MSQHTDRLISTVLDDKYLIEERLGSGGMCNVYRARHVAMDKELAIKVLKPELAADAAIAQRFEQEARAASRVRHPHAINVTDYGIGASNTPYLVMELVEGKTIRELISEYGPLSVERTADILRQTCAALEVAHSVGVIHRDIKPDNIIISQVDGRDWVEVLDFGVAKIQEDMNRRADLTGANHIIGTPRYMSPEQCEEKPVDSRSDIYSLGVVVYEMLAGEAPFDGDSSTQLLMAHASQPPPHLSWKRPDIPPEIEATVMRALEKNPDRRQQSAAEFAREFDRAAGIFNNERDEVREGAFSRINVPLHEMNEADRTLQPAEAELDEATLVRRRMTPDPEGDSATGPLRKPDQLKPYDAGGDLELAASRKTGDSERRVGARDEDADPLPSELDKAGRQKASKPALGAVFQINDQKRSARSPALAIIGVFALAMALGFILYAAFWNRAKPSDQPPNQNASAPQAPERATNSQPPPEKPAPDKPAPAEPNAEKVKVETGAMQKQVSDTVVNAWKALENRNLNGHMRYYAPRLQTFYLKSNVERAAARAEIASALSSYDKMNFSINNIEVHVDPSGKTAIATYDKTWNFNGSQPWSGTVRERLWLVRNANHWQINGIRDLKVY
ncbi:MAG TPA: protein kinase [Blastocatellia bacterium]|nr:protein kinase [Blastocatellia bacterium]